MNVTLRRWNAVSRDGLAARTAVFAFAAVGHWAFLATLFGSPNLWVPFALAAPNLFVLAWVTFGRRHADGIPLGPTGAVVVATSALGVVWGVSGGSRAWLPMAMIGGIGGTLAGLLGATVATPLCLAVLRWRLHPAPRRVLDVWATLACIAAVFAAVRPDLSGGSNWMIGEMDPLRLDPQVGTALRALDGSLHALAMILAAAVFALDLALRHTVARARGGAFAGRWSPLRGEAGAGDALSLATMHDEEMVALLGAPEESGYRDAAPESVRLALPTAPRVSWRLLAMPVVAAACALGFALRR